MIYTSQKPIFPMLLNAPRDKRMVFDALNDNQIIKFYPKKLPITLNGNLNVHDNGKELIIDVWPTPT